MYKDKKLIGKHKINKKQQQKQRKKIRILSCSPEQLLLLSPLEVCIIQLIR
jgi:hypothetical protein